MAPDVTTAECAHPAPVTGVMAHEFSHYDGALGPEGTRRTTTYYGPVLGGLPISAWHCEECGLLRLNFPDGRREERTLFPGPQPGLLAEPSAVAPGALRLGRQARVSGLSAPEPFYESLVDAELGPGEAAIRMPRLTLPHLDVLAWFNVVVLTVLIAGLLAAAVLAVAGSSVSDQEGPLVVTLVAIFGGLVVVDALAPVWKRVFPMPPLAPSVAVTQRARRDIDPLSGSAVAMFILAALGLLATAVLATYSTSVSSLTGIAFLGSLAAAFLGLLLLIAGSFVSRS
jgi:hypothetical protein